MPVVITPSSPGRLFGPGLEINLVSDTTAVVPSTAVWQVQVNEIVEVGPGRILHALQWRVPSKDTFVTWYGGDSHQTDQAYGQAVTAGTTVRISAQLTESASTGTVIDQGQADVTFEPTAGLADVVVQQGGKGQGLTQEQSQQLLETWSSTAQVISIDSTVQVSGGTHPPGSVVSADLPVPVFGLIIRITEVPDDISFITADGAYSVAGLAVVNIFRGSDVWMRVPIHTQSKVISLFSDVVTAAVATVIPATWLLRMSYQVAFREGVGGEVIEMRFP